MTQMQNELMQARGGEAQDEASPGAGPSAPSAPPDPHAGMLSSMLTSAKAKYSATSKVMALAQATRKEVDQLVSLGDAVTTDDVLEGMAKLVGAGADPKGFISMMQGGPGTPPMPDSGPALAAWLAQQEQVLAEREEQLEEAHHGAEYDALTSAVHVLANHHVQTLKQKGASTQAAEASIGAAPPGPPPPNPLGA